MPSAAESYTSFLERSGRQLRLALIATYGPEVGSEAAAEAFAYGWEHWDKVGAMVNPAGYLYRVGQSRSRRFFRARRLFRSSASFPPPVEHSEPWVEPELPAALQRLSDKQRTAVMAVHGFHLSVREAADLLGVSASTVQQNAERGLAHLRESLGVEHVA